MRRFPTGHAVYYNLRHQRHGHLFQNRYKSILCQEDAYLLVLVRYIHLNLIRFYPTTKEDRLLLPEAWSAFGHIRKWG